MHAVLPLVISFLHGSHFTLHSEIEETKNNRIFQASLFTRLILGFTSNIAPSSRPFVNMALDLHILGCSLTKLENVSSNLGDDRG